MLPEGGSVIDFLEVILSDFARLESETAASEATEQDQYDKFMFTSRKDKALKENDSEHKSETKTRRESALHSAEEELKTTQEQLDKALAYYEGLKTTQEQLDKAIAYYEELKTTQEQLDKAIAYYE